MGDDEGKRDDAGKGGRPGEETTLHGASKEGPVLDRREGLFKSTVAVVMVANGPESGLIISIGERLIVGRDPANTLQLSDASVSRNHLEIVKSETAYLLKDLGSSNGTLMNGDEITGQVEVPRHATINAGIYELIFFNPEAKEQSVEKGLGASEGQEEEKGEGEAGAEGEVEAEAEVEVEGEAGVEAEALAEDEEEKQALVKAEPHIPAEYEEEIARSPSAIPRKLKGLFLLGLFIVGLLVLFFIGRSAYRIINPVSVSPTEGGKVLEPGEYGEPTISRVYPFLEITTEPLPARVWFNGKDLGIPRAQPLTYKESDGLEPGVEYEIKALFKLEELDDEVTEIKYLTFTPDEQFQIIEIKANIGVIHIKKIPRDVILYLEYTPVGVGAPGQERVRKITEINYKIPLFVPYGRFKLELRRGEDILYRRLFEVTDESSARELSITEEELTYAPMEVLTEPSEAEVFLDGQLQGKTPIYLEKGRVPFGTHELKIVEEDYLSITETLTVEVNEPIIRTFALQVSEAGEFILRGKMAYEKGLYKQVEAPMLEAMKHNPTKREKAKIHYYLGMAYKELGVLDQALIHLSSAQKHEDFKIKGKLGEAWVYFDKGEKKRALDICIEILSETSDIDVKISAEMLFAEISPLKCAIYVNSDPNGATIYLNNNIVETKTPVIIYDLYPGKYRVMIKKPGYETQYDKFDISIGRFKALYYTLKRLP